MRTARHVGLQAADALAYVVVLTGALFLVGSAFSLALGQGFVGTKYLLFFVGFGMFGYAAFLLRPKPPWKGDNDGERAVSGAGETTETEAQDKPTHRLANRLLPANMRLPPDQRLSAGAKMLLAAIAVLATSYVMEAVFNVAY
ncbi:hypothetical protein ACFO0N_17965 [Halobium salinum]|uniref:Uncharacterized protein n=1 Tax=Halobium salinum TaxID=1364940 RepID=A0ABD5PGC5_9EURY|nr:hypothetical protein [Halobium salinum]